MEPTSALNFTLAYTTGQHELKQSVSEDCIGMDRNIERTGSVENR